MATNTKTPAANTTKWNGVETEVLSGVDLKDKAELVGIPFRMTGFKCTVNDRQIAYAWVEAEDESGNKFTFNDSSSGVRAQVEAYLVSKDKGGTLDEWIDVSIVAPRGLRVSEYDVKDERGKDKRAKTFYITTSGVRA